MKTYNDYIDSNVEWIDKIPREWQVIRIKNVGNARNGLTYSPENVVDKEEGILVLRSSNIQNGKLCFDDNVYVNMEIPENLVLKKGDILICSRNGSKRLIGKNAFIESDRKMTFGAFMMILRTNIENKKYIYWILNSGVFDYYLPLFFTSTINQLTGTNFGNMKIPFCLDNNTQDVIARFLDEYIKKLDDIYEEIQIGIQELQNLKSSVVYKAVTEGLDNTVEFAESDIPYIRRIPKKRERIRLKYLCDIMTGNQDTQNADDDGVYPFYVRSPIVERCNEYTFEGEGILMAGDGVGAGRVFHHACGKYAIHQRVYCLHNFRNINTDFLMYYISELFKNTMDQGSAQSTVPSVRLPMITNFVVYVPSRAEQIEIVEYLDEKCTKINDLIDEKKSFLLDLENYKKSFIFEVVTGKRKVV